MLFKPTRLLGGEVASGKATGKGKAHAHVSGAAQGKCQIRGPGLQTNKGEPSALTSLWKVMTKWYVVHPWKMNLDPVHM